MIYISSKFRRLSRTAAYAAAKRLQGKGWQLPILVIEYQDISGDLTGMIRSEWKHRTTSSLAALIRCGLDRETCRIIMWVDYLKDWEV